jgi:hypothetical protein
LNTYDIKELTMNTFQLKSVCSGIVLLAGASSVALADPVQDGIVNCAGLKGEQNRLERLACFDRVVEKMKLEEIQPFSENTRNKSEHNIKKQQDYDEKHANDRWFLRSTTQLGDENVDPAQIALTRSNSNTTGVARIALIYADEGGIGNALGLKVKGDEKWFAGIGIHRDDSIATKKVSTSDLRLGYAKAFSVFPKRKKGQAVSARVSLARLSDHIAGNSKIKTDLSVRAGYRWIELNEFDEVKYDRSIQLTFNPFSDKTTSDPSGINPRTSGIGLGFGFSWYRPTDVGWMPTSARSMLPDRWFFDSLRNVGTANTKQYSTLNKLGFTWDLARSSREHFQPSITLAREVGANFREGLTPSAKTLLTLNVKYN